MPILDFKEIPGTDKKSGFSDDFELFARDFFLAKGMKILEGPSRGIDNGKDLIVQEKIQGILSEDTHKWLVSCKHFAHSGNSVRVKDEDNIADRIKQHGCHGFIGFYSTLVSSGLETRLNSFRKEYGIKIYDNRQLEGEIFELSRAEHILKRYFPKYYKENHKKVANIFSDQDSLKCDYCGKDLFIDPEMSIITLYYDYERMKREKIQTYEYIHFCCKGNCDERLSNRYDKKKYLDQWEDISDLMIPTIYIKHIMALLNKLIGLDLKLEQGVFEKYKDLLLAVFPFISRELSSAEKERVKNLMSIPIL